MCPVSTDAEESVQTCEATKRLRQSRATIQWIVQAPYSTTSVTREDTNTNTIHCRAPTTCACGIYNALYTDACVCSQTMRKRQCDSVDKAPLGTNKREKRGISTMSKKIDHVLKNLIVPLASQSSLPPHTVFRMSEHDCLCSILTDSIIKDCPTLSVDKESIMRAMDRAYTQVFRDK